MSRRFIAAVLAASTAIAAFSAAPARAATEEDIARLLAGAATIFIIGKAIQNARDDDDDDDRRKVVTRHDPKPKVYHHQSSPPKLVPRGKPHRDRAAALPAGCVRQIEGGRVNRVIMGRCLERNNISVRSLPKACRMNVETRRGTARAYALPCLRHRGYTLARY
ncbi:hypothetical protein [Marivita sp.]|uniref:hypothetical protein n=1 Tax=Marivita sp. TaxID=2003365 RepID=UPI0025BB188B|nr:hypothetical protein [Marivita sp.]